VNISPDGQQLTSVDLQGRVFVWDISTLDQPQLRQQFATAPTRLSLVAFSGDGQLIAVGQREGQVQVYRVATGELMLRLTVDPGPIVALALSADGQMLVAGGQHGSLYVWTLPDGHIQQVIKASAAAIDALAFSPDGESLASTHGSGDFTTRLWTVDAQRRLHLQRTLVGHTHIIWTVVFGSLHTASATGREAMKRQLLVTGSSDQTVRVWDAKSGQSLYTLRGHPRALCDLAVAPHTTTTGEEGWLLAAASYDRQIHLWTGQSAQAATPSHTLQGARKLLWAVAISPDSRLIAGAGQDDRIYLWEVATGQLRQTFQGHTKSVHCLAFHPDGALLASGSTDSTVRLWQLTQPLGAQEQTLGQIEPEPPVAVIQAPAPYVYAIAFSPDGRSLVTACSELSLRFWDMTQQQLPEISAARKTVQEASESDLFSVAFSPDGKHLACCSNPLVYLWDLQGDEPPQSLPSHTARVLAVAFSPDGAMLASAGEDCTVCLWDVASGALSARLSGHKELIYRVAFSPDGTTVFSCGYDGMIKLWHVQTGDCRNTLVVEGPYAGMNIAGVKGITEAQKTALKALGAVE